MKTLSNPEKAYSYHLYGSGEDGLVTFVLSVPIASLQVFIDFADHRKKIFTAPARAADPEVVRRSQEEYESYCKQVLSLYDGFIKQCFSHNEAISKSNKSMKDKFLHCTYERTKNIVLKNRRSVK